MQLNGSHIFEHPQEKVWSALMDPKVIANAIPGVEELQPIEGESHAWRAEAKIGIAAVSGRYSGIIRMSDIQAPRQYRLTVSGEGQQSIINGTALITLNYDPDSRQTTLTWDAEANINGNLARVGQRVIKSAAGLMSRNFFDGVDKQIPAEIEQPSASAPPTGVIGRIVAFFRAVMRIFKRERSVSS